MRGIGYLTGPSDFGPIHPVVSKWIEHPKITAKRGDLLLTVKGSGVGKVNLLDDAEVAISRQLMAVRVTGAEPRFIYAILISTFDHFQSLSTGAAIPGISREQVLGLTFTLPPLTEQQRIVALFDEAFAGLATAKAIAEQNLQNARAIFESHLEAVFSRRGEGWVEMPFEECIEDVKYTTKIQRKDFLGEGEFPIVSQEAEFTNGYWDNAADVFRATKPLVIFGDHTQVLKYIDFDFVLGADGVKILPPKPFMNPKFFFYALRSAPLKSLGYSRHYRLLKELQIVCPDMNSQDAIVKKLDAFEEETQLLARLYERKLAALEELNKSLLHQAFNGEL